MHSELALGGQHPLKWMSGVPKGFQSHWPQRAHSHVLNLVQVPAPPRPYITLLSSFVVVSSLQTSWSGTAERVRTGAEAALLSWQRDKCPTLMYQNKKPPPPGDQQWRQFLPKKIRKSANSPNNQPSHVLSLYGNPLPQRDKHSTLTRHCSKEGECGPMDQGDGFRRVEKSQEAPVVAKGIPGFRSKSCYGASCAVQP